MLHTYTVITSVSITVDCISLDGNWSRSSGNTAILATSITLIAELPAVLAASKCKPPCTEQIFTLTRNQVSQRMSNASTIVWISFDTLSVRVITSYDLFDLVEILSAIGGSLGLFLGYSMKSVTDYAIRKLQRREGI
jgi:hypothetical protein